MQNQTSYAVDATAPLQIAIPVAYTPPPVFGDKFQAEQYFRLRDAQRESQSSQFCVAPRCTVTTLAGRVVGGGEPLTPADVGGDVVVQQLARAGIVIVIDAEIAAIRSAPPSRYTVAASATISRTRGILARGSAVTAADFAEPGSPARPARAAHVNDAGVPVPAAPADPGRPASDGTAELTELIRRGVVADSGEPAKGSKR